MTAVATADELRQKVKVVMFDQYGTVVDMQQGLTEIAAPFLKEKGWTGSPGSFVTWWRRTHFENSMIDALLHKAHTPYREIGHAAVAYTLDRAGIAYTPEEVRYLVGCIEQLRCFPDVPEALARLRTKFKIAVLSNGDPDMLEAAKPYHGITFDRVISVAEAGSFKPHVATYTKAAELMASAWTRCSSSRTTPSTASGRRPQACTPRSSTGASDPSAARPTSRTSGWTTCVPSPTS